MAKRPVWVSASREYFGETLKLVMDKISGRYSIMCVNQWGEIRTPVLCHRGCQLVASMKAEILEA